MVGWRCVGHECAHWWSLIRRGWTVGAASFVRAGSTKVLQCAVYSYAGAWMVMASGEIHYLDAGVHPHWLAQLGSCNFEFSQTSLLGVVLIKMDSKMQ